MISWFINQFALFIDYPEEFWSQYKEVTDELFTKRD